MKSDPKIHSQRTHRAFTTVQREAILAEYAACENAADRAAVIRKHAIYSSHLGKLEKAAHQRRSYKETRSPRKSIDNRTADATCQNLRETTDQFTAANIPAKI